MFKPSITILAVATFLLFGSPLAASTDGVHIASYTEQFNANAVQQWRFRVLLGKREIGFHEFRVDRQQELTEVNIDARFDVNILFFNAYSYSHQNEELWRGDCLTRLLSRTDDNGEMHRVRAEMDTGGFVVTTSDQRVETGADCVRSFAYWNPDFLDSSRLLNSQTGEIVDVEITHQGADTVEYQGVPVAAHRYTLQMDEGAISLWYSQDNGQWLALEAPTPNGRTLRYEPLELPFSIVGGEKLAQD